MFTQCKLNSRILKKENRTALLHLESIVYYMKRGIKIKNIFVYQETNDLSN